MSEKYQMYTLYRDEKPVAYLYGPSWKAMELMMEGGYRTPEEAREAWEREEARNKRESENSTRQQPNP